MACYYCQECDQLKDDDYEPGMEWENDLICEDCHMELVPENFEDWTVSYWQKPIPDRSMDWEISHNDYDPTPLDSYGPPGDDRFFTGPTLRDVWQQACEYEIEQEEIAKEKAANYDPMDDGDYAYDNWKDKKGEQENA